MSRDWLAKQLAAGHSVESVAREVGKDPSTVGYWMRKHGLVSVHAARHTNRGALDRTRLEELVGRGLTTREIAAEVERSQGTVRRWLKRYGLSTVRSRGEVIDVAPGGEEQLRVCRHHGETVHRRRAPSGFRCLRCRSEAVAARRRRVKAILVAEAGGACMLCGYDRCVAALEFHHRDPATKRFAISFGGLSIAVDRLREEARKCVLVCANCHAELEVGAAILPRDASLA